MATEDITYQTDVFRQRPGDTHHIGSDGSCTFWSGGELMGNSVGYFSCEEGFEFFMNDMNVSAARMFNFLAGRGRWSIIGPVDVASEKLSAMGGSSPPVLPSMQGYIVFSINDDQSAASARLPSAHQGEELVMMIRGDCEAGSIHIFASGETSTLNISGVGLIGHSEDALSAIILTASADSRAFIRLCGVEDGVWAIIDNGFSVSEVGVCVIEEPAA